MNHPNKAKIKSLNEALSPDAGIVDRSDEEILPLIYWSAEKEVTSDTLQPLDTHNDEVNPADSPIQRRVTIKQGDKYSHL